MRVEKITRADFMLVLEEVFGPRAEELSDDLRDLLHELWGRGVEAGVFAREHLRPLPEEIVVPPRFGGRSVKKAEEMQEAKAKLVEMAETVALRIENGVDPTGIARLEGDDVTKAVHNFLTYTARIEKRLADALREAERFRLLEK
jgi:hypothetical protein